MKFVILIVLVSHYLFSINMTPLYATIESKKARNTIFKVSNPTAEPVAVTFSVLKVVSTDNNEEIKEATSTVQAYPTQFVLSPNESKSVRVRYMGKHLPLEEEVYRIIAEELDIEVNDEKEKNNEGKVTAKIKTRFSYQGLLFLHRANSKEKLIIKNIEKEAQDIKITIENIGQLSVLPIDGLYNYFATLKDGKEYPLSPEDLKGAEFRRVLAGKTNTFHLKNIKSVPVHQIESMRLEKK